MGMCDGSCSIKVNTVVLPATQGCCQGAGCLVTIREQ